MPAETYRARQTEAEFMAAVIDCAKFCGWLVEAWREEMGA